MWWDGLVFFGFDDTKLARLNGAPVSFTDKFKNKKWLIMTFTSLFVVSFVIITETSRLGTQKSQTISLIDKAVYDFDSHKVLTMHAVVFFYFNEVIPIVN
jgi:Na+/H+ antiporter NhaC